MTEFVTKTIAGFQATDLIDIIIVATLLYLFLIWFKQTRAAFILFGILIFGVIYFLARRYELYLTVVIFQGFFAVLLVALVVIFQEELRHFFERIAIWGLTYRRAPSSASPLIEILMRTISEFSTKRIGTLIVLAGRDPLDRHLKGGLALGGEVSEALLHSLFDPHSLGHDGAVLIDRDRVSRFACYLPLSQNLAKTRHFGTRHAAALGLSERTDALCLVVSEENGHISIAEKGNIKTVDNVGRLAPTLEGFFRERFPAQRGNIWMTLLARNFWEKAAAVLVALVLWLAFGQRVEIVERDFVVPVQYKNLPMDLYIKEPGPEEAVVTLSGYKRSFNLFDSEDLAVQIDLGKVAEGSQTIPLLDEHIPRPESFDVKGIDPRVARLKVDKLTSYTLKVEADLTGSVPEGIKLKGVKLDPHRVSVFSSENKDVRDMVLKTEPISLEGVTEARTVSSRIVVPPGVRHVDEEFPPIDVTIMVEPEKEEKIAE